MCAARPCPSRSPPCLSSKAPSSADRPACPPETAGMITARIRTKTFPERGTTMLKFTEEHEWLQIDGDIATVGITTHAAEQLGDLVFVELPEVGGTHAKGGDAATVESVKAASD